MMAGKGTLLGYLFTVTTYKFDSTANINYKRFANMKGKIYGNWLPRDAQVKKSWEPLL
jgi:hypothetical protein